jgi:hypothetical protein
MKTKLKKMWLQLTTDRRRFGLFCGLLLVGLLLWARIIVIARPARTAVAQPLIQTAIETALASDNVTIPVSLQAEPKRNPFSVNSNTFPFLPDATGENAKTQQISGSSSENDLVQSLKLEAVIGEMAMIDGLVIQIGEIVGPRHVQEPLRLFSVEGRIVILSAGDRRYELSIAPPHQ